jgi:hypothetical protein
MKKMPAFTVLETIIALTISAIVISGTFVMYQMIFKQWTKYRRLTNEVYDAVNMERLLKEDAAGCSYMYTTTSGLYFERTDTMHVVYSIQDSFIVRSCGRLDTFYTGACTREAFFNKKSVADSALIDHVNLSFIKEEDSNYVSIEKQYAAEQLFRFNH